MPTRGRRECASACDTQACLAGLLHTCASAYLYSHRAALVRRMLCTLAYPLLVRYALSPGRHGPMEGV